LTTKLNIKEALQKLYEKNDIIVL